MPTHGTLVFYLAAEMVQPPLYSLALLLSKRVISSRACILHRPAKLYDTGIIV